MGLHILELLSAVLVIGISVTAYVYITLASGFYMDSLSFDPAVPSAAWDIRKFAPAAGGISVEAVGTVLENGSGVINVTGIASDDAIYSRAYYSVNGSRWKAFELLGGAEDGWLKGSAAIDVEMMSDELDLVPGSNVTVASSLAIFSCTDVGIGWDCMQGRWRLKVFSVRLSVPDDAPEVRKCGSCMTGYRCVNGECVMTEDDYIDIPAGESLAIKVGTEKYLITVTAIGGSGDTAKISLNGVSMDIDEQSMSTVTKSALSMRVLEIQEFTASEDGYVRVAIDGRYEILDSCPECIRKIVPSGGGSSSGGGGSSCNGDCSCASSICTTSTCPDGCGGTCTGTLQPDCGNRTCGAAPNGCGTENQCGTCSTGFCNVTIGTCQQGTCTPDCGDRICGDAPNGCGSCGTCSTGTCMDGICMPTLPPPPQI